MTRMTLKLVTVIILERILVMNEDGTMNEIAGKYEGMDRFECRKQIVKDLQEAGVSIQNRRAYSFSWSL